MGFILPLIYILSFTNMLNIITKKEFEKLLPFTFMISAIMLFISQFIFKTFYVGFVICIIFALIFPIRLILKKEKIRDIKENYITNGVIQFIILYCIIFILDFNRFFTRWDELSHWGKMVKEMFKLDSFYSVSNSNLLVHKDYPPIISLMELFYTFISCKFKETYLIRCIHLFTGSLIISTLKYKGIAIKKSTFKTIISIIFIYMLTLLFDKVIILNGIYVDYVLALFVAYLLFNIFKIEKFSYIDTILLSISFIFLLLSKQVSIAFYLMSLFLLAIKVITSKMNLNIKKILTIIIFIIVIPILLLLIWNNYIDSLQIKGQFSINDIKLDSLISILKGQAGEEWQLLTIKNYALALFNKSIINSNLNISFAQFIIITLFLIYILYINIKKHVKKGDIISLTCTLLLGYVGYTILMLLLYVYSFGEYEGPNLASYERYMSTYVLICFYTIFYLYSYYKDIDTKNITKYIIIIFVISLLITPLSYARLRPDLILLDNNFYDKYKNASNLIDEYAKDMDKVYIIDQNERDGAIYYINYFSNKISTNVSNYTLSTNVNNTEQLFYNQYFDYMKNFDYLYTYNIDDEFIKKYSFLLDSPLKEGILYKINIKDKRLFLEEIN